MNPADVLSSEVADLALALGLLTSTNGEVAFDSDFFSDPGAKVATALADEPRRDALVRFVDAVNGDGGAREVGGVTFLKLFSASDLGLPGAPDLTLNLSIDDRAASYVEVGLAIEHATTAPVSRTQLEVPLYRTGKRVGAGPVAAVAERFALAGGSPIRLRSTLSTASAPDPGGFSLDGVEVAVAVPVAGGAGPSVELSLVGLRLPGATAPTTLRIGGADSNLEQSLLSLVLGIVRAGASSLGGPGATAMAALDLIGLGPDATLPPLDVDALLAQGGDALRSWLAATMGDTTRRRAWLDALREVIGGNRVDDVLSVALGGGPANLRISFAAQPGADGHMRVTPRLGLDLSMLLGAGPNAVRLSAEAVVDVLTVNLGDGSLVPVPDAELRVTVAGNGTRLLPSGPVRIGSAQLGLRLLGGTPLPLVRVLDVAVGASVHEVLDLSSADAVVALVGETAGGLLGGLLDTLVGTGVHLKALLGIDPPPGVPELNAAALLADPLAALRLWWGALVTAHPLSVPAVLTSLRDLVSSGPSLTSTVGGTGTAVDPWTVPILGDPPFSLELWREGTTLVVAPALRLRVSDLAGGCTVVTTTARVELAAIDLATGQVSLLRAAELSTGFRGRGSSEARLSLGPVAIVAQRLGFLARWTVASGFTFSLDAPGLAADLGDTTVPLALPVGGGWEGAVLGQVENLAAVLGATNPAGWLHDVVDLLGWRLGAGATPSRLDLARLVADPGVELQRWVLSLLTDEVMVGRLATALARLLTGSSRGLAGVLEGRGTPTDPWVVPFGASPDAPSLTLAIGPAGPQLAPSTASDVLQSWRPGLPGLSPAGLAQAVLDEGMAGDDTAALARGREGLAGGLEALVARVALTDVLVAPPTGDLPGVNVVTTPAATWRDWVDLAPATALKQAVPAGAAVLRLAVGTGTAHPWTSAPAGRLIDLSAPGLSPESFTVDSPDAGEWFVVLATRAGAALGSGDPTGLLGQAARLRRVIAALGSGRPVVVLAVGGAGHAARVAADAEPSVSHLVTLGTPWSPVSFDTARNGPSGDALRLLEALLPALDDDPESDDPDLAVGRALVTGLRDMAQQADIEAPRPEIGVRAGLTVRAWFGSLERATVERAITAIVAAGLAARARARAAAAAEPGGDARLALRLPVPRVLPGSGGGIVVEGHVALGLTGAAFAPAELRAAPSVEVRVVISSTDAWLLGGPGTVPSAGAQPVEVRFVEARVTMGLGGAPSTAELILHEAAALGARRDRIVVRPDVVVGGTIEDLPFLPEVRTIMAGVANRLRLAPPGTTAVHLSGLLEAIGLTTPTGLVPDALTHLLHDPVGFLAPILATAEVREALVVALSAILPGATRAGQTVTIAAGPTTFSFDLATRRASATASAAGALPWALQLSDLGGPAPTGSLTIGSASFNTAAVRIGFSPTTVALTSTTAAGDPASVSLWPSTDLDGLTGFAAAALPAEAVRLLLEAVRGLDPTVGGVVEALAEALSLLGPPDADGRRAIAPPLALVRDPGGWFRSSALGGAPGVQLDALVDVLEALKPFVGLADTPRGSWPVTPGLSLALSPGAGGPRVALVVDPTAWLGGPGRAPFAAGFEAGFTIPNDGAPLPSLAIFAGVPEAVPTPLHRRAVHLSLDAAGPAVLLRPEVGEDIPIYPNPAGLGALLTAGVELLLPKALDALARLSGDADRLTVGRLVSALGRGLDVVQDPADVINPATFDGDKLSALASNPEAALAARAGALVTQVAATLDPLLSQLPGSPRALLQPDGSLEVSVRDVQLTVQPSPLSVLVSAAAGLPVVGRVAVSLGADATGLTSWSLGVGPAAFDLDGAVLRPVLRGSWGSAGAEVQLGLALDVLASTSDGHRELLGRWREAEGFVFVARTRAAGANDDDTDEVRVALFTADAVLEILGNWVIGLGDVSLLLNRPVGATPLRELLQGSVLAAPDRIRPGLVSSLPGSLFVLARNLAGALPGVPLGPVTLSVQRTGDLVGLRLAFTDTAKGLELNPGSDVVLSMVADATWIEPPSGTSPAPGVVVDILSITAAAVPVVTVSPGVSVNGVGLRIAKASGPLLDAGLRLDSAAVHLFGSVAASGSGGAAVSGGVQVELAGLAVPLGAGGGTNPVAQGVVRDAGSSGSPPTPKFSPALAVQSHHGGNGPSVSLRAGSGDGPWYLPIQRAFGPVYLEQIGLGTGYSGNPPATPRRLEWIALSLDGSVSLFGITASVDKLRLTYHVNRPFFSASSWEVDLDGFAIASSIGGLTLAGALRRTPLSPPLQGVEYLGMLKIGFSGYGIDLFGGYAHPTGPTGSFASFFAFGALHAPLGGPPAFFITGIGLGLGINRELTAPTIDTLTTNPFLVAMKALGPAPDPMAQLEQMRTQIRPAQGQFWVAAGISFTSFVLITGEVVVTVELGDGLDITVLGLARAELPAPSLTLVSIELALLARFSTKEGSLLVAAQLTENSWLLMRDVRLTGGFAFATWWKGPNAGQFVVTMGGYHPKFSHAGYPTVPRLGLRWQPSSNISVIGESYFALCSEALMAGTSMEVAASFGPAHARLSYGGDGIVFFDPFWFEISAHAEIAAGIRIWLLFGTVDIEVSLGATVKVSGPPIFVEGHFEICGFEVPFEFGDRGNPADRALSAGQFRDKYLRASSDAQVIQAAVVKGAVPAGRRADAQQQKVPDGSPTNPFLVIPEFGLVFITTAPAIDMSLRHTGDASRTLRVNAPDVGVAPMFSHTLSSDFHVEVAKLDAPTAFSISKVTIEARPGSGFPKGVWGEAPNRQSPAVPAGEVVTASDGFAMSTSLGELTGAPAIDYHQVELPFGGRKPLPFVTGRAATDARVAAVAQLKAAADAVRPADSDLDQRFNYAARVLDAGGYGRVGVAALRGERASAPAFGSLADDMVKAPAVLSPKVKRLVVDHHPPVRPFVAPIVKSVVQAPLLQATAAAPHTTVAKPGAAFRLAVPSLDRVRADVTRLAPASLLVRPGINDVGKRILARGSVPVTRLTTAPLATVANARPDPAGEERLLAMSGALAKGTTLREGELAVITVGSRPVGERGDRVVVTGGAARVIALAAGGNVLFDNIGTSAPTGFSRIGSGTFELPAKTERVVVAVTGEAANVGGTLDGWYAGQSLPLIGWDMAVGAGVVVTFASAKLTDNRDRGDGGWGNTRELARAAQVATRFDAPVRAVAVAVEDAPGTGRASAASDLEMRLEGARRAVGDDGQPTPPQVLVQGVRTILLFEIEPEPREDVLDPHVMVIVEGRRDGHLAGVVGTTGLVAELAGSVTAGFDAAVRAPLPGGTGTRSVQWRAAPRPRDRTQSKPRQPKPTTKPKGFTTPEGRTS